MLNYAVANGLGRTLAGLCRIGATGQIKKPDAPAIGTPGLAGRSRESSLLLD
ncbi:hypothetical protein [Cohnella sp. 56]|uniref:hypothetical protein n=1 Tax=Cohnella sp. 56 TaxID=3113722 RepID=UPI0030E9EECA